MHYTPKGDYRGIASSVTLMLHMCHKMHPLHPLVSLIVRRASQEELQGLSQGITTIRRGLISWTIRGVTLEALALSEGHE